jgi:endonuclease III
MNPDTYQAIFAQLQANNPHPTTELIYQSSFELLIAVMLSAQATDISVNKATKPLFAIANTPQAIIDLGVDNLKSHIKTIGLFNSKAKHIMTTCQQLIDNHQGQVPSSRAELENLPGVGRKTANVILNTAFHQATIAVDTHIFRVANRIGLAQGKTPLQIEQQLLTHIPKPYLVDAHHWLILHGRYVCKARKPLCANCSIKTWCEYPNKTS